MCGFMSWPARSRNKLPKKIGGMIATKNMVVIAHDSVMLCSRKLPKNCTKLKMHSNRQPVKISQRA